jgi:Cu/Ag efflux pump CusA
VFPLAYGLLGDAGWIKPMVFAMGWGLLSATILTLIFIPALFCLQNDLGRLTHWTCAKLRSVLSRSPKPSKEAVN